MESFVSALWELRTWFALFLGIAIGLMVSSLMVMSRRQEDEDGPPTILILPPDEPMQQVDMKDYVRRWS